MPPPLPPGSDGAEQIDAIVLYLKVMAGHKVAPTEP
jgi:hypothetical protein